VTKVDRSASEHVDVTTSHIKHEFEDLMKVRQYLDKYSPFLFSDHMWLISFSFGIAAGADDAVNCDIAVDTGFAVQKKWDGYTYNNCSMKKVDQIKTLAHVSNSCIIDADQVVIDPSGLFHCLLIVRVRVRVRIHIMNQNLWTVWAECGMQDGDRQFWDSAGESRMVGNPICHSILL
jgi:hypothetical protein